MAPTTRSGDKGITEVKDIPTIKDLWATGVLTAVEGDKTEYEINQSLNERVSIWRGALVVSEHTDEGI